MSKDGKPSWQTRLYLWLRQGWKDFKAEEIKRQERMVAMNDVELDEILEKLIAHFYFKMGGAYITRVKGMITKVEAKEAIQALFTQEKANLKANWISQMPNGVYNKNGSGLMLMTFERWVPAEKLKAALEAELPKASIITTKYGYTSKEKKYGFRIGITEAREAIAAVFNKGDK